MAYKYYPLTSFSGSPSHILVGEFQALLNEQFDVASDFLSHGALLVPRGFRLRRRPPP